MKKIPERTCVITKEKTSKNNLIRIVKDKEGHVFIDLTGKSNGRGAYLKKDFEVIEKARKTKALDRVLETTIPESIYEELNNIIK